MGCEIVLYRARIGIFKNSCTSHYTNLYLNSLFFMNLMFSLGLTTWLFALILLSGDIEKNPGPSIQCLLLNTRSVKSVNTQRNKLLGLITLVKQKNAKVVCLTETWLTADIADSRDTPV